MSYFKYQRNSEPVCPHCDEEIVISEHELYELYDEEITEFQCPFCTKTIKAEVECSYTFNTSIPEED